MALYLRFTHFISYQRLRRLFEHLFGLAISEGALDALFRRAKPAFDDATSAILAAVRQQISTQPPCPDSLSHLTPRWSAEGVSFAGTEPVLISAHPATSASRSARIASGLSGKGAGRAWLRRS